MNCSRNMNMLMKSIDFINMFMFLLQFMGSQRG